MCVCVFERERERERVCVCVSEIKRERECMCVCVCVYMCLFMLGIIKMSRWSQWLTRPEVRLGIALTRGHVILNELGHGRPQD